jgi:hypothetical protein
MQLTPESPPGKRSRAKAKSKDAAAVTAAPRKPRKAKTESVAAAQRPATDPVSTIATTAYYLAAERNFAPGHELDDWLEAERRVQSSML